MTDKQPDALQYADRDHIALGDYYLRHVSAMTGEALHAKSAIAAELAHRDREIDRQHAELETRRSCTQQNKSTRPSLGCLQRPYPAVHCQESEGTLMTTITISGAAIQRYKIGYHSDEWGVRSSTPSGIPDASGPWILYEDHVTALKAAQPAGAQQPGAAYAELPDSLICAVDQWFADNIKDSGGCTTQDVRELAEIFYDVTYDGGRESADDALAIVKSLGPGIGGLNDAYARQVLLAEEVKRLREQAPNPERTGELLMGLAVIRELTGTQQKGLEETIEAVRAAVNAQKHPPAPATLAVNDDLRDRLVAISEAIANQDDRAAQAMLREILAAPTPAAQAADSVLEAQEPFAWHVCSVNSDGSLSLEHAAAWEEAAHEHINDAITEHDIEGAGSWVVRPAYHAPQPSPAARGDAPESLVLAVDQWFADNIKDSGGCTSQDVRELAELFYDVTHEGGRESVDDALAIVESFGPGIGGLNDAYARQVLLAEEVKRLREQAPNPERTGELLMGLAVIRELTGTQQKGLEETIEAVRAAVNAQKHPPAPATQQAGAVPESIEQLAVARYKVVPAHESMFHSWAVVAGDGARQLYLGRKVECENMARKFAGAFLDGAFVALQNAAPTTTAQAAPAAVAGPDDYTPLLDDEGRMMVGTSHHYTAENIRALVAEYKALEAGGPDTWELHYNTDHRARAGVLWRVISALADEVPFAAALATQPAPQQEVQEPSPTAGMSIAQRILHVGGRNNAAGYVEFGSTQAVEALVKHVLRDLHPSPAAQGDALDAERYRWLRRWKGQEHEPPFTVQHEIDGILWGGDLDAAIDAARARLEQPCA